MPHSSLPRANACPRDEQQMIQENMKEAYSVLLLSFGKHTLGFLQFSLSYAYQPYLMWEAVHKGIKTKREGIMGVILEAGYHCWRQ